MAIIAVGIVVAFLVIILMNVGGFISQILGGVLYAIATPLMWLLDFVQVLFRKLAGLDTTYVKDTLTGKLVENNDDILFSILTNETVLETFMAMCIVGICLLMITSVVQMIRVEYTTEGSKNNKFTILSSALKGFSYFFIVPIATVLGILVSNAILKAVDAATSGAGASTIAGSVFVAAANDANRVRANNNVGLYADLLGGPLHDSVVHFDGTHFEDEFDEQHFSINDTGDVTRNRMNAADKIDAAFSQGSLLSILAGGGPKVMEITDGESSHIDDIFILGDVNANPYYSYDNVFTVGRYYALNDINYLILYVGLCLCIVTLFKACFGMIMRIYTAIMLFIISPGVIGIWPLDGGKAFSSWRTKFVGSILSAYGVVVALNLYFVIAGALDNVALFSQEALSWGTNGGAITVLLWAIIPGINATVRALFVIVGALMVSSMSSTISSLIGADDGLKQGGDMTGKVAGAIGKGVGVAAMGVGAAVKVGGAIGGKIGKIGGKIGGAINDKKDQKRTGRIDELKKKGKLTPEEEKELKNLEKGHQKYLEKQAGGKDNFQKQKNDARIQEIDKQLENGGLSVDQKKALEAERGDLVKDNETLNENIQKKTVKTAKRRATMQQLSALGGNFFKNSGLGKSLNTMSGGLIGAFGGDAWDKAGSAAAKKDDGYSEYKEIIDTMNKTKPGSDSKKKATTTRDTFNKVQADRQHYSDRAAITKSMNEEIKINGDETNEILQQILRALKDGKKSEAEKLQLDFNKQAAKMGAMGVTGTDQWKSMVANMIKTGDTSAASGLQTSIKGAKIDTATMSDEAINTMANKMIEMGAKGIQTFEKLANSAAHAYAEKSGKPEIAVSVMTKELEGQNEQIIKLLTQMVNNSKK